MNLETKPRWSTLLQLFWLSYPIPFCLLSPILNSFHQVPLQVKLVAKRKHNPILGEIDSAGSTDWNLDVQILV